MMTEKENSRQIMKNRPLRKGWTTGACATAATKAALTALITGEFPDPVGIILPKGDVPYFQLSLSSIGEGYALAGIIKDAGDDPDVTNGATIISIVHPAPPNNGIIFKAGDGVGTVTRPGLPISVGEAAINPVPRQLMQTICEEICAEYGLPADLVITISVPNGQEIAKKTWNPRLGIEGGISILGTTGVVHPFSCSAWIHSIHRGIDVARAEGVKHVIAATGSTSEDAAQSLYHLPDFALLDMGDFVGGVLKYLHNHPIDRLTLSGGFAKFTKLAQGHLDLHSSKSQVDKDFLWMIAHNAGLNETFKERILNANTAKEVLDMTLQENIDIATPIALEVQKIAKKTLRDAPVNVEVIITDRKGKILAKI
ncbi:cobalt-precorrin-5B (C(1))-methyltransferase [Bartonella tamiae]|uniref:Cobalt-precorrin-5B C(1)-methyltransferase n=1 Tax=Bartonella tamiae Th239 TaxID=1094558 RepID=J0ZKQ6_9HYPH|nr:cobalt-precorrin-5B (C(1))-methyltransferase [Bartonella tamiae]EJF88923.1 cobalamin biosynthesis protein CbiD [Bartonella tamiae Th239]EJF94827.1 cobalamin biosynthesis protein CbiD [Bartonella tamiae Th307]